MAVIKLGALISGIRGTVGGVTYSANRSGPYAKSWSRPPIALSPLQAERVSNLAGFAAGWQALSAANQATWDAYAPTRPLTNSLGETYNASGFNWYCRINTHLEDAGLAWRSTAPTLPLPAPITAANWLFDNGAGGGLARLNISSPTPPHVLADYYAGFLAYVPAGTYATPPTTRKLLAVKHPESTGTLLYNTSFQALYGDNAISGWVGWIWCYHQDLDGQRSDPFIARAVVP